MKDKAFSKVFSLLSARQRRAALVLLVFIVIGTLFEVLGIGLLLPVIVLLSDENLASRYPMVQPLLESLGNPSHQTQVKIVMFALIGVYTVKNLYLAFLSWWRARFSIGLQIDFSERLFTLYMRQPYNFHLQRNSAQLIRNITGEVGQFTAYAVNPILMLMTEVLVLVCIATLLFAIEPLGTLVVVLVMSLAGWFFHRGTRIRITRWGEIRQYHDGQRIQHLQQGLAGIKDVKLLGREADFLKTFSEHNFRSGQMAQFMEVVQKLPRLWLELLAVIGFALLVIIMMSQQRQMATLVPTIGLFAAAAFRLMPSVSRILGSVQRLRYGLPPINRLFDDFQLLVPRANVTIDDAENLSFLNHEILLDRVSFQYQETPAPALEDITLTIAQGASVGFIGPSGSGKSTLVDIILGLLKPNAGQVCVDGTDIEQDLRTWQDQIGYVPQSIFLTDDTLRRNIAFGLPEDMINTDAVARALKAAQLEDFVSDLPDGVETIVGERGIRLSGGQRQRIGIARALYHEPDVLVLDEATSALDTVTEQGVMRAVTALHGDKTVIIVAHRLSTVEHCDRLYRLEQGRIVEQGTPAEMIPTGKVNSAR